MKTITTNKAVTLTASITKIVLALLAIMLMAGAAKANANTLFSLQNLERERAALLFTLTTEQLSIDERFRKVNRLMQQLADIERMVLRDDRLTNNANSNSMLVKKAFANYDLTFLIHASAELKKSPINHWLTQLNFTTENLLNSTVGER